MSTRRGAYFFTGSEAMNELSHKRILIVEDEEAIARMMQWQLESAGYEVHTEDRGRTAVSYVAEHRPDLVVLDLRLPDLHGYDVSRQLREVCKPWKLPILMVTAMDRNIDRLRGFAHGADAYLTKPYEEADLIRAVTLLLVGASPV